MKYDNLTLVNKCLDVLNEDRITSSEFTYEFPQKVYSMCEDVYYESMVNFDDLWKPGFIHVSADGGSASTTTGIEANTLFFVSRTEDATNDYTQRINFVDYNRSTETDPELAPDYIPMKCLDIHEFVRMQDAVNGSYEVTELSDNTAGESMVKIRTDRDPTYYTVFSLDDTEVLMLDSYDSAKFAALPAARLRVFGEKIARPTNAHDSTFIVDDQNWPGFLRDCQAAVYAVYKDGRSPKLENLAKRNKVYNEYAKTDRVNYGRR